MAYDPNKTVSVDIEQCNKDLAKKNALGRVEIGLYSEGRPALYYDPDKVPKHQAEDMAQAYIVRLKKPLLGHNTQIVIPSPGLFERKQKEQAGKDIPDFGAR